MQHGGEFQADLLYQQAPPTDDITSESMGQTSAVREQIHIPLLQLTQPQEAISSSFAELIWHWCIIEISQHLSLL